jgi:hypothetical protein
MRIVLKFCLIRGVGRGPPDRDREWDLRDLWDFRDLRDADRDRLDRGRECALLVRARLWWRRREDRDRDRDVEDRDLDPDRRALRWAFRWAFRWALRLPERERDRDLDLDLDLALGRDARNGDANSVMGVSRKGGY